MGVIDSGGDNVRLPGFGASEGNSGYSFAERLNFTPGSMCAFREHAEGNAVVQRVFYLVKCSITLPQRLQSVPLAGHGQDLQETEGFAGFPEDVRPGTEYGAVLAALEHHKGVHEGVGVVRRQQYGAIFRDGAFHFDASVALPCAVIHIRPQKSVPAVALPNLSHCSFCSG